MRRMDVYLTRRGRRELQNDEGRKGISGIRPRTIGYLAFKMGRKTKKKHVKEQDGLTKSERREIQTLCSQLMDLCKTPTQVNPNKQWEEYVQIRGVVEMICTKQRGLHNLFADENRDEMLDTFFSWVKDNGAMCSDIQIAKYDAQGYGIQATKEIKEGDIFLSIPRTLMMTVETAVQSEFGKLAEIDPILKSMPNVLLAIHVLNEKYKQDSFWKPYLDFLPHSYSVPLYFTEEEMKLLQGSPAYSESMKQYKNIARQYAYFNKLFYSSPDAVDVPLKNTFTYDGYRWAVSTVMTRQNQVPSTNRLYQCTALIPLWDMCNHTNGQIRTGYDLAKDCSSSIAVQNVQANDQVLIYYGKRTNMEFLVHNGFTYPDNKDDGVAIQLGISKNDVLYQSKMELLSMFSLRSSVDTYTIQAGDNPLTKQLLVFLRIFCMTEDELNVRFKCERKQEMLEFLLTSNLPVSKANEIKLWSFLETRLGLLLKLYKTTIEEDEELLNGNDISDFSRLAIQLRFAEKKILNNAVICAKQSKEIAENWDESTLPDPLGRPNEDPSVILLGRPNEDPSVIATDQAPEVNGDDGGLEIEKLSLKDKVRAQCNDDAKKEQINIDDNEGCAKGSSDLVHGGLGVNSNSISTVLENGRS